MSTKCPLRFAVTLLCLTVLLFTVNAWSAGVPVPLWSFGVNANDGTSPFSNLIFDPAGNLYGTTQDGGTSGFGVVFKLTPTTTGLWKETILYNFKGSPDGANPVSGLVRDAAGNLYGTTFYGGHTSTTNSDCSRGCGTIFKLTPTAKGLWTETVLHRFTGVAPILAQADGSHPGASLIQDKAGNFYSTTVGGGAGVGTVFKLTITATGAKVTTLHNFDGDDGAEPFTPLVFDGAGNLYGTTTNGGAQNLGAVFKLTLQKSGAFTESVLHSFQGGNDGANPFAGVVLDKAGNVFGTSQQVGNALPCGTVFELTAANHYAETVLHRFEGTFKNDGCGPNGLVFDGSGNLFGTAEFGGPDNAGTIFKLTHEASGFGYATLFSFNGDNNVEFPFASLVFGPDGDLFGSTLGGGGSFPGGGEVFKFVP